ncbi:hypothetical protein BDR06DRAFT_971905 [Suillus hirtellus]|nr:hypothetical protein BDR06DRAFT_971905 [Suillus hirtellus]
MKSILSIIHKMSLTTAIRFADMKTLLKVLLACFNTQCIALELVKKSVCAKLTNSMGTSMLHNFLQKIIAVGLDEANSATATEQDLICSLQKKLSDCQKDLPQLQDIQRVVEQIVEQHSCDTELQIQELKHEIGSQYAQLLQRSMNTTIHHKQRDLNNDEWMLVRSLAEEATAVFECTIAEKENNIRIRNNLIETLQARSPSRSLRDTTIANNNELSVPAPSSAC